ncbi:MAG: DNA-directed RNA polymerase subunit alpha C-terminal domain-containing protein [Clostridia bacterium]
MLRENLIEELDFSTRVINALHNADFYLIGDLLSCTETDLSKLDNLGKKSINEIVDTINKLKSDEEFLYISQENYMPQNINNTTFIWKDGKEYYDIHVCDMNLSVRAYNSLINGKLFYFSQIFNLTKEELISIPCVGSGSVNEIAEIISNTKPMILPQNLKSVPEFIYEKLINNLKTKIQIDISDNYNLLLDLCSNFCETEQYQKYGYNDKSVLSNFFISQDYILNLLEQHVLNILSEEIYGLDFNTICKNMPSFFSSKIITGQILENLINQNNIYILDDKLYCIDYASFIETAHLYLNEKESTVLKGRINGKTLSLIGQELNITRERTRQIELKSIHKIKECGVKFKEDIYKYLYENYYLTKENFLIAFDNDVESYNYLEIFYKNHGIKPMDDVLYDEKIPAILRKKIEKAVYKNYILIDNEYVKLSKSALSIYILKKISPKSVSFQEFTILYENLLKEIHMHGKHNLALMDRGYENKLSASDMVLWKYGKKFRYYNIKIYNFKYLLEALSLNQYENIEFSCLKFFNSHPEIMDEYDIRDEYELHNLLKKICNKNDFPNLEFKRMPNIEFGTVDRNKQIMTLLSSLSPISNMNFAKEYENVYGVRSSTVIANYMKNFDKYFYNGIYQINFPKIPIDEQKILKARLTKDYYLYSEIDEIYQDLFQSNTEKTVNPYVLKSLGFKTYSSYVINSKFSGAVKYFNYILTSSDFVDITSLSKGIKNTISFTTELSRLKSLYELIEISPNHYININKLGEMGVTKELLYDYHKEVLDFAKQYKFFTVHFLKSNGFKHKLHKLGFDNWFYTSIIIQDKKNITFKRLHDNKIIHISAKPFTLSEFLEYYVKNNANTSYKLKELSKKIEGNYDIRISTSQLTEIVKSNSLHYDPITKSIFKSYKSYIQYFKKNSE